MVGIVVSLGIAVIVLAKVEYSGSHSAQQHANYIAAVTLLAFLS